MQNKKVLPALILTVALALLSACAPKGAWDGAEATKESEKIVKETCGCLYTYYVEAAGVDMDGLIKIIPKYKKDQRKVLDDKMTIPEFQEKWHETHQEIRKAQAAFKGLETTDCFRNALQGELQDSVAAEAQNMYFRDHCRFIYLLEQKF